MKAVIKNSTEANTKSTAPSESPSESDAKIKKANYKAKYMQLEQKKHSLRSQLLRLKDKDEYIQKLSYNSDSFSKSKLTFLHLFMIAAIIGMVFGALLEINYGVIELTGLDKQLNQ